MGGSTMRAVYAFLALVLIASTAHGASPSPGQNSLVIVACKVVDWTGKRPLPENVFPAQGWKDLELFINDNQEYECKREVAEDLQDAALYHKDAPPDTIPLTPDFSNAA